MSIFDKEENQIEVVPQGPVTPTPVENLGMVEYKEKFAFDMVSYFKSIQLYTEIKESFTWANGEVKEDIRMVPNRPPMLETYARQLGVSVRTLRTWGMKHKEFAEALSICEDYIKEFMVEHGLKGNYNSSFGIFTAKNLTDMKDKSEITNKNIDMTELIRSIEDNETPLFER